jgi:hypothetical protein
MQTRSADGKWLPGVSGNKGGRLPREKERKYLDVTMARVSPEEWGEIIDVVKGLALEKKDMRAIEWMGRYLLGDPTQVHEYLLNEKRDFTIRVVFEEHGAAPEYDVIDGEKVE